jgi:hypothetical protein
MVTDYVTPMDKTYSVLGPPKISLEEGVNETIAWLRTQPEFQPTTIPLAPASPADNSTTP